MTGRQKNWSREKAQREIPIWFVGAPLKWEESYTFEVFSPMSNRCLVYDWLSDVLQTPSIRPPL